MPAFFERAWQAVFGFNLLTFRSVFEFFLEFCTWRYSRAEEIMIAHPSSFASEVRPVPETGLFFVPAIIAY